MHGPQWGTVSEQRDPEIPKVHVYIGRDGIALDPATTIGKLDWRRSLIATREMNPKPILVAHLKEHINCKQEEQFLRSISVIYQCGTGKCVLDQGG